MLDSLSTLFQTFCEKCAIHLPNNKFHSSRLMSHQHRQLSRKYPLAFLATFNHEGFSREMRMHVSGHEVNRVAALYYCGQVGWVPELANGHRRIRNSNLSDDVSEGRQYRLALSCVEWTAACCLRLNFFFPRYRWVRLSENLSPSIRPAIHSGRPDFQQYFHWKMVQNRKTPTEFQFERHPRRLPISGEHSVSTFLSGKSPREAFRIHLWYTLLWSGEIERSGATSYEYEGCLTSRPH